MKWDQDNPTLLALENFNLGFDIVNTHIDGEFDFGDNMSINKFRIMFDSFKYGEVSVRVPKEYKSLLKGIETNAIIDVDAELTKPFYIEKIQYHRQ